MPIYDFECMDEGCGKAFESLMKPYEPVKCPHCDQYGFAKRVVSGFGGYKIRGDNSASTSPKGVGAVRKPGEKA
jgi:putative FmdB family regulatory protein